MIWLPEKRICRAPSYILGNGIIGGAGGATPFVNTYSCYFDGVNNYGTAGTSLNSYLGYNKAFTWSVWYKRATGIANGFLIASYGGGADYFAIQDDGVNLWWNLTNAAQSVGVSVLYAHGMNTTDWYHLLLCYNGNNSHTGVSMYQTKAGDTLGPKRTLNYLVTSPGVPWTGNQTMHVGRLGSLSYYNKANHDEWAFWDSDQSTNASTIYNGGTTRNLSTLPTPPRHWWRMGDDALDSTSTIKDQMGLQDISLSGFSSGDVTSPGAP